MLAALSADQIMHTKPTQYDLLKILQKMLTCLIFWGRRLQLSGLSSTVFTRLHVNYIKIQVVFMKNLTFDFKNSP